MKKVAIVGAGKRFLNVYLPIFKKLEKDYEISGFVSRTEEKGKAIEKSHGIEFFSSVQELIDKKSPDFFLAPLKENVSYDVVLNLMKHDIPVLIETPISDQRFASLIPRSDKVGVVEQWPFLPLEQFKQAVFNSGLVNRPFLVQNDGRSFDYHAIAQLRAYLGNNSKPAYITGNSVAVKSPDFIDNKGKESNAIDSWDIGTVKFENGSVLIHNFSYLCKTAPYRVMQSLRSHSDNGTIFTGKKDDKDNDYEIVDIRYVSDKDTNSLDVVVDRDKSGNIKRIYDKSTSVSWTPPYEYASLTDQEIAISSHLYSMSKSVDEGSPVLYSLVDAFIDYMLISGIKQACYTGKTVRFG